MAVKVELEGGKVGFFHPKAPAVPLREGPGTDEAGEVLSLMGEAGFVTTGDVVRILGIPARRVRQLAKELMGAGKAYGCRVGGGWTYWRPDFADADADGNRFGE